MSTISEIAKELNAQARGRRSVCSGFFSDGIKRSHTRLLVILCVPLIVLVPILVWALLSLRAGALQEIPLTITGYLGAANGIILGYAAHNKREERKAQEELPQP